MNPDPPRDRLRQALWKNGTSLAEASLAIGRNKAYLHQYFSRRMPRVLSHQDSEALGRLLGCDPEEFRHAELPAPKPWTGKRRKTPAAGPALATVSEVEVEASAGPGAFAEEFVQERARWRLPEVMVRHEGHADPDALRILRVRGNSMEPELREGDRVVVDTARRVPLTGEMFVLWDGTGLVVKRVAGLSADGILSLLSATRSSARQGWSMRCATRSTTAAWRRAFSPGSSRCTRRSGRQVCGRATAIPPTGSTRKGRGRCWRRRDTPAGLPCVSTRSRHPRSLKSHGRSRRVSRGPASRSASRRRRARRSGPSIAHAGTS